MSYDTDAITLLEDKPTPIIENGLTKVKLEIADLEIEDQISWSQSSELNAAFDDTAIARRKLQSNAQAQVLKSKILRENKPIYDIYRVLQEWEGVVREVSASEFEADLADITQGEISLTERVQLNHEEISPLDATKLRQGAVFRWIIGYRTEPSGERSRFSKIIFRDLPRVSEADYLAAKAEVRNLSKDMAPLE